MITGAQETSTQAIPDNGDGQGTPAATPYAAPSISAPRGGGAIRGIGEKFAVNPATGTGSMTVRMPTSPGRSGFGPELSLSYDSGAGNGVFGFGWSLSLPNVTRKTDKGLPLYWDDEESDVFVLSGAEDLVPVLGPPEPDRTVGTGTYRIQRYRPRVEGLFAPHRALDGHRTRRDPLALDHARQRHQLYGNATTTRGSPNPARREPTPDLQLADLGELRRQGQRDPLHVQAGGRQSTSITRAANERNRSRTANRHLKSIRYGNRSQPPGAADLAQHDEMDVRGRPRLRGARQERSEAWRPGRLALSQ